MSTPDPDQTTRIESTPRLQSRSRAGEAQFAPGTLIAGRYRIAGLLGSGGMGEVYRADDIKLDQPVALKFLPARLAGDERLLMQLHDEVRLGRQIAHPNVCRIYDIGEFGATHFVAMEYVDGEDLRRLLHRIGRLPHDKAVDIVRGVAAGLHAAHVKGILHRDLKPANVMLDSQGYARITDFGLALSTEFADAGGVAGTPAYMAPEQLEGAAASVQTDLYSFGVLMYELFTGKRPYSGGTFAELRREVSSTEVTTPSEHVRELEPAVERVILRCLNRDPALRPRSAREIIDALPGGDPLAAALAAGEPPSPKIIAAAGSAGSIRPAIAWALLACAAVLVTAISLFRSDSLMKAAGVDKTPDALADRAHEILRAVHIAPQPYSVTGFVSDDALVLWTVDNHGNEERPWRRLNRGPAAVSFWVRESPSPLVHNPTNGVYGIDRPSLTPGSSVAAIDRAGRLTYLRAIPEQRWTAIPFDRGALLKLAGFDVSNLKPVEPQTLPAAYADRREAWTGVHPDDGTPVRIEAAWFRGVPVLFDVTGPWTAAAAALEKQPFAGRAVAVFVSALLVGAMIVALLFAIRNLRLRRGDRSGAFRVAAATFLLALPARLIDGNHTAQPSFEIQLLRDCVASALLNGAVIYVFYIALEPFARRRWPHRMIAWSRLVAGNVRDPMVSRDVLIGMVAGLAHAGVALATWWIPSVMGIHKAPPRFGPEWTLRSLRFGVSYLLDVANSGLFFALALLMLLTVLTIVTRRRAAAIVLLFILLEVAYYLAAQGHFAVLVGSFVINALTMFVLARFGILAMAVMQTTFVFVFHYGAALDGTPYAATALFPIVVVSAVALWAFRTALGGQSPWSPALLDD